MFNASYFTAQSILTALWLMCFAAAVVIVESYFYQTVQLEGHLEPVRVLLEEKRPDVLVPVISIYSAVIIAILAFWFTKPFPAASTDSSRAIRRIIAIVCTILFNAYIIYLLSRGYFNGFNSVDTTLAQAVSAAKWLAFLVTPVNIYYFGSK
ncbi:hypothetical protein J7399_14465 [Shimia sp. R9_1]|uniref:hypothetical protein n=1 Tax=Shimia sp. R9_1 TaxID=2821111 RepID=UPI001ADBE9EF|nr:hypothetical protein [Shimia sp. R9_1]MBO9408638.1 hypothetical protein [Shimia sp. R9_1]